MLLHGACRPKVWPDLERLHDQTLLGKGSHEATGDRRLSNARRGAAYHQDRRRSVRVINTITIIIVDVHAAALVRHGTLYCSVLLMITVPSFRHDIALRSTRRLEGNVCFIIYSLNGRNEGRDEG